ncbi:MAG: glycosyltransferase family 2 protein [Planctomycetes bacterium]|nr:glycosyltransferase family 2 protein [Planctomycetota bacterium]
MREHPVATTRPRVGAVVIGRNEGERLKRCIDSVLAVVDRVVYVDSGSSDGSVEWARARGVEVVELDLSRPFTAARARNEGFARLMDRWGQPTEVGIPAVEVVQFLDGDCVLDRDWIDNALGAIDADRRAESSRPLAVVCGRRRETDPDASPYNRLCDIEWNTPIGEADACGGDALVRRDAFEGVGGYDPAVIAGEEPELCVRLRLEGWRIERLDAEMTRHDAAMHRFSQWWRRNERAGHAYAEGRYCHGSGPTRHYVREVKSNLLWAGAVPIVALALSFFTLWGLLAWLTYPILYLRVVRSTRRRGLSARDARLYAWSCTLGKFPQLVGMVRFHLRRWRGTDPTIIEYKGAKPSSASGESAPPPRVDHEH